MRLILALVLAIAPQAMANQPAETREFRSHLVVSDGPEPLFVVTQITRLSDQFDESVILVHDVGHGDYIIRRHWAFDKQIILHRLSDVKDRAFVQVSYKTPFTSKTRLETLAEGKQNPGVMDTPPINRIETNGGEWQIIDDELKSPSRLRKFRRDIRQHVDFVLLEAIERMRGTSFTKDSAFFELLGHYFVYESSAEGEGTREIGAKQSAPPDCAFDSRFGFPCSQKQLARIKKASADSRMLEMY